MIYLVMVRQGACEVCSGQFYIEGTGIPKACPHCGSFVWLYGVRPKNSVLIRQGITKKDKVLNKGVKSKGRQEWSRAHPFGDYNQQRQEAARKKKEETGNGKTEAKIANRE